MLLRYCALFACGSLFAAVAPMQAQEVAPSCCGHQFTVTGDIHHAETPVGASVPDGSGRGIFVEEVYGKTLTATIPGLDPGTYTIEIDLIETTHKNAGERTMDITAGGKTLVRDLDIFKAAGGFAKPYKLIVHAEHLGDMQRGPLTLTFAAKKDAAKFNAIFVRDAQDQPVGCVVAKELAEADDPAALVIPDIKEPAIYRDPAQPMDQRVDDLIRRMSLKEKTYQLVNAAGSIERLGVPAYDYWSECLHGVARNGFATVFPEPTGLAATWDISLAHQTADVISTEARAKYNAIGNDKPHGRYQGLTFWTPNINIYRDPRWGRGQETYGEDPLLTARFGVAIIKGLQGDDPTYLKVAACAKHFAVHSGPEQGRRSFAVTVSNRDLYETYLPQFETAVKEGKVATVMGAYNSLNGEPCCSNSFLLQDLLRDQWGFTGHVVSDCGAVRSIFADHKVVPTAEEASARAIKAGLDLECGGTFASLIVAKKKGLITEAQIDHALHLVLAARFELGMFDPPGKDPYDQIAATACDTPEHQSLALKSARESMVLLKNSGVLPLDKTKLHRVAVIGSNADSVVALTGNYNGTPSAPVTFLRGIEKALGPQVKVVTAKGCPLALKPDQPFGPESPDFKQALAVARDSEVVFYIGGISPDFEGEEMKVNFQGFKGGDRTQIELPAQQTELLKALHATGKPVIFVNCSGGAVAFPWEAENLPAILQVWYPGEAGGTALADILFGDCNPSGHLPVTFYRSTQDLPAFTDYSMVNRTYRYFSGTPLYPFGYGLSYTRFEYGPLTAAAPTLGSNGTMHVQVEVKNSGARDGDEVVQFYARHLDSRVSQPIHNLIDFQRVTLAAGESKRVGVDIPASVLRYWDVDKKAYVVEPGKYEIQVGASSADLRGSVPLQVTNP